MSRDLVVNGEVLVKVQGGSHMSGFPIGDVSELGLTSDKTKMTFKFNHKDINVDDFGPLIPAEVMCQCAEVNIHMNLIHYDYEVLDVCMAEAMGGGLAGVGPANPGFPGFVPVLLNDFQPGGTLQPTGTLLGNMRPILASGCHFITVNLTSPVFGLPWNFLACYLTNSPAEIPLGTDCSIVPLQWRCIPYRPPTPLIGGSGGFTEILSSGIVIWNHEEMVET